MSDNAVSERLAEEFFEVRECFQRIMDALLQQPDQVAALRIIDALHDLFMHA